MIEAGLPEPELQFVVRAGGMTMRCDFAWPEQGLIGEADGIDKYGKGQDARDAIAAEKRRQARLQAADYVLYRWGWHEVHPQWEVWLAGLRRELERRRRWSA